MLRPLTEQDRETFIRLADEFYHSPACLHPVDVENFHRTLDEILSGSPFTKGYLLKQNDQTAGYALVSFTYSNEAGGLVCLVEEAYVTPAFQGNGLGKELCAYLEQEFPEVKRFRLEVTRCNERAISLYKLLGYENLDYLQMIKDR